MTTTDTASPGVRQVAASYSVRPGWVALAVVGLFSVLVGEIPLTYQYLPLVVSVVLIGLPHGAVDHLVLPRQREESLSVRWLAVVGGIYLLFGLAYGLVWFQFPVAAFVFFICLTWFHWGQGELYPLIELLDAAYVREPIQQLLTIVVRGGAPMVLPLVAFPHQYEFVAASLIGLFDPATATALTPLFESGTRLAVAAIYGTVAVVTILRGSALATNREAWLVDAGEVIGLSLFFLVVPPVLAIGVYFCFWHSLRHVIRTVLVHDRSVAAVERRQLSTVAWQFAHDATPMTAGALALLGSLFVLVPESPGGTPELVALYLVLIAVLTLPHAVIVSWLDREQAIY